MTDAQKKPSGKPSIQTWIHIGLIVIAVVIAIQNAQATPLKLLFVEVTMPLVVLLAVLLLLGFVVGFFSGRRYQRKKAVS